MREDIERWNGKFAGRTPAASPKPDALLASTRHLPTGGLALDLAAGSGHNAVWLAERGFDVIAVDGSVNGLSLAKALARRRGVSLDAAVYDLDRFELGGRFELVIVMQYLNRPLFARLPAWLAPGGILVVKTFNRDFLDERPGFNPDYVLDDGELPMLFGALDMLEHAESPPDAVGRSHIICRG